MRFTYESHIFYLYLCERDVLGVGDNIFERECLAANDGNGISFLD